jgi:hypothetical protein
MKYTCVHSEDGNSICLTCVNYESEITKLKSELEAARNQNAKEHFPLCNILVYSLQEENLSLSVQVNKLREALNLAVKYPRPYSITVSVEAIYKTPATSLREAADFEDQKEVAWKKIMDIISESPSPKDIGKVVREVDEALNMRPEVLAFAWLMEDKLRQNDHKGGWKECSFDYLMHRLVQEQDELLKQPHISEAVDVANFAMMIADVICQGLDIKKAKEARTKLREIL